MFAPNGLGVRQSNPAMVGTPPSDDDSGVGDSDDAGEVGVIGQGYLHVQSRLRVTRDGGHSILAVQDPAHTTRLARVPRRDEKGWNAETAAAAESAGGTSAPSGRSPAEAVAPPEPVSSSPPPNVEKSKQAQTPVVCMPCLPWITLIDPYTCSLGSATRRQSCRQNTSLARPPTHLPRPPSNQLRAGHLRPRTKFFLMPSLPPLPPLLEEKLLFH